jgi:hypothetical protein
MCRANNNWETSYSTLTKSNENSSQSKKQRECGESARDSLAYSCLLKNELLGASIDDIKNVSDENKIGYLSNSNRGLFKYQPTSRQVIYFYFLCPQLMAQHINFAFEKKKLCEIWKQIEKIYDRNNKFNI